MKRADLHLRAGQKTKFIDLFSEVVDPSSGMVSGWISKPFPSARAHALVFRASPGSRVILGWKELEQLTLPRASIR
jgi:hypothetical protein